MTKHRKKSILVLADCHKGGEWIANLRLFQATKTTSNGSIKFHLAGFGKINSSEYEIFEKVELSPLSTASKPFSFIKKLILNFLIVRNQIQKFTNKQPFDYIWTTYYFPVIAVLSLGISRKKIIYYFEGTRVIPFKSFFGLDYRQKITKALELASLLLAKHVFVPSNETGSFLLKHFGPITSLKKLGVIPNSVSAPFFKKSTTYEVYRFRKSLGVGNKTKIILYCGRIARYKGIENLIEAFGDLRSKKKDIVFVIAHPTDFPDTKLLNYIRSRIKIRKISEAVKFIKGPKQTELINLYHTSDLTVLPTELEMAPLVLLESMAASTPCIGTKVGNIEKVLSRVDPTLILENNSVKEIYTKIKSFIDLPDKKLRLIKSKSYEVAKMYSSNISAGKLIRILNRLG